MSNGRPDPVSQPRIMYLEPLGVMGGMDGYNECLVGAYRAKGFHVDVVSSSAGRWNGAGNHGRLSSIFRLAFDRKRPAALRALAYGIGLLGSRLIAQRSTGVVVHFFHLPAVDLLFLLSLRVVGIPIILVGHDPRPGPWARSSTPYRICLRQVSLAVVHGSVAMWDMVDQGVPPHRIAICPFGTYRPATPIPEAESWTMLGQHQEYPRPVAAIIGHMKPGKGIERARRALEDEGSPVRTLLLAGETLGDWDFSAATTPSPDTHLHIVTVNRRMSELEERAAYSAADVILTLYERAYSSAVIARAHSLKRPVILTRVGDLASQALDGDQVIPGDYTAKDLARAVTDCLSRARTHRASAHSPCDEDWLLHVETVILRVFQKVDK